MALQERSLMEVLKWRWSAPKRPASGWLMSNPDPTPEDLKEAFPVQPVDTQKFAQPSGATVPLSSVSVQHLGIFLS